MRLEFKEPHAYEGASEGEERVLEFGEAVESAPQAAKGMQEGIGPFDHPAGGPHSTAVFGIAFCQFRHDAEPSEQFPQRVRVITTIALQTVGLLPGRTGLAAHRRHCGVQSKPVGFTKQVNQAFLPFLERADVSDAFYTAFDNGVVIGLTARDHSENQRFTWQYGIYRPLTNTFAVGINKGQYGGRVTGLPIDDEENQRLVHLGFGTLIGEIPLNELRVRARPLLRNGPGYAVPIFVDTGIIGGSRQYTLAPEFAAVSGSWTVQAEWTGQFLT